MDRLSEFEMNMNFSLGNSLEGFCESSLNSMGIPSPTSLTNSMRGAGMGIGTTLLIIGAVIVGVFGFILSLVFGAQLSSTTLFSSLPATNQTKINANIGNGVVAGSAFVPLIYLGGAGALSLAIFALIFLVFRHIGHG